MTALAIVVLISLVLAVCAWLDRKPCPHNNNTRYVGRTYCRDCEQFLEDL